jgi:hypothetical protein
LVLAVVLKLLAVILYSAQSHQLEAEAVAYRVALRKQQFRLLLAALAAAALDQTSPIRKTAQRETRQALRQAKGMTAVTGSEVMPTQMCNVLAVVVALLL